MIRKTVSLPLASLAERIGAELAGPADQLISGVATLRNAGPQHLSFFSNRLYLKELASTRAGAVIINARDKARCPVSVLIADNPYLAYAKAAHLLCPPVADKTGVHPTAWIDPSVTVPASVSVGPQAVVEADVELGEGVVIGPGCVLHSGVRIGAYSRLEARVTVCGGTRMGCRVLIHPGAVIGADGFGLAHDGRQWLNVPQLGGVSIGDDVEIGANTTIDRGALDDTVLEDDVRLDNQIQIGHNAFVGAHTAIAGCAGIAGSARIGRRCLIGGGVGIVGHIHIADDVHITAGSNVLQPIDKAGVYSAGTPIQPNKEWHKNYVRFKQLDQMAARLRKLTGRNNDIQSDSD